jgi:hypothetical protein
MKKALFDLSGGQWLGMFTATMIVMSAAAFILHRDIPAGVLGAYTACLSAFAISKTIQKVKGVQE